MENTVVTIARLSASEKIRQQCLRREMFEMDRHNAIQTAMQNGYERGHLEGVQQGRSLGADDAFRLLSELSEKFSEADRSSELSRAVMDAAYREKLLAEFGLVSNK